MSDVYFDAYDTATAELGDISSLLTAALCVRENQPDLMVITDLLYLVVDKVHTAKKSVETMHLEHRKLEKEPSATPPQSDQPF